MRLQLLKKQLLESKRKPGEVMEVDWVGDTLSIYDDTTGNPVTAYILVPDKLKIGVIKNTSTELVLNRSYHEMAEYYGTAIIPVRPVSPKDYLQNQIIFKIQRDFPMALGGPAEPVVLISFPYFCSLINIKTLTKLELSSFFLVNLYIFLRLELNTRVCCQ